MGYEIYQKHGEGWVKLSVDPKSIIDDTLSSSTTTWSSLELKSRFESLAGGLKAEVVTELPTTGVLNTLYYVGTETPYHIYLYANNSSGTPSWFDMGTTGIALTDYYSKTQSDARYLQLAGGTMTGTITTSNFIGMNKSNNSEFLTITAGTTNVDGANLGLNGGNATNNPGDFLLRAISGGNTKVLRGKPNGTLTWDNKNIITETTGDTRYLKLSGGTMTGGIITSEGYALAKKDNTGYLIITGGTSVRDGASLSFNGGGTSGNKGDFVLKASTSSSDTKTLRGKVDGSLTWNGSEVLTEATGLKLSGGSMTGIITTSADYGMKKVNTTGNLSFTSGTDMSNGGCLGLNGATATYNPGDFTLRACISDDNKSVLRGKANGELTWNEKKIMYTDTAPGEYTKITVNADGSITLSN